jgi:hypothetical protein
MEGGTFLERDVQQGFRRFLEIRLHTDGKGEREEASEKARGLLSDRFSTLGVPYYAVLDPTGERILWQNGGVLSASEIARGLASAP